MVSQLAVGQKLWQHASDFAAPFQHRIGHAAHQAHGGAAVDETDAGPGPGQCMAQPGGGLQVIGMVPALAPQKTQILMEFPF